MEINKFINSFYLKRIEWTDFLFDFLSYLHVKIYLSVILLVNAATWYFGHRLASAYIGGDQITLHYNVDFGINMIGDARQAYIIPTLGLSITIFNLLLLAIIVKFSQEKKFNRHLLLLSTLLVNIFLLVAIMTLNFVNIDQ